MLSNKKLLFIYSIFFNDLISKRNKRIFEVKMHSLVIY